MIKVYFESKNNVELIAEFYSEDLYMICVPVLEAEAERRGMVLTESIIEENEN